MQVNRKAGLDFATVMRAFLRADPDVIMVGEMRDQETVGIGIEASLTGHLVLATLHTNSAPESIVRLLDMGMDPFNFADALLGILAQRLARRLCAACKLAYQPDAGEIAQLLDEYCAELRPLRISGRSARRRAARAARLARALCRAPRPLHPVPRRSAAPPATGLQRPAWPARTDDRQRPRQAAAAEHARVAELLAAALEDGMLTLKMDGIEKVLQGLVDMRTVRQVCRAEACFPIPAIPPSIGV